LKVSNSSFAKNVGLLDVLIIIEKGDLQIVAYQMTTVVT